MKQKAELNRLETRLAVATLVALVLCLIMGGVAARLDKEVYAKHIVGSEWVKIPHTETHEIWDYTCYTTTYGECYHEGTCHHLSQSSHKTTVADALEDGYRACSVCDPPHKLPVIITETKYIYDKKVVTMKEKYPSAAFLTWAAGAGAIVLIYVVATKSTRKRVEELSRAGTNKG